MVSGNDNNDSNNYYTSSFLELGMEDGHEIVVADVTTPKPVTLTIKYIYNME